MVKKEVFQFYKEHDKIRMHAVKERCANKISGILLWLIYKCIYTSIGIKQGLRFSFFSI